MNLNLLADSGIRFRRAVRSMLHRAKSRRLAGFAELVRSQWADVRLIRIGEGGDGGYLVPDDLEGIRYCFSPGVGAVMDFEQFLADRHGIKSFLADASIDKLPTPGRLFEFDQKFLAAVSDDRHITLSEWIQDKVGDADDMILQMDIEGAEFDVFMEASIETLSRFRILVCEFHKMHRIFKSRGLHRCEAIFRKLGRRFSIAHIHPNNNGSLERRYDIEVPSIFEVTFIRTDRVERLKSGEAIALPHRLDSRNVTHKPDMAMPEIWWRQD